MKSFSQQKPWKKIWGALAVDALLATGAGAWQPSQAEATVVRLRNSSYMVDINDSSVYMRGRHHANVVIAKYTGYWQPAYPVEIMWGAGFACYRIDSAGNRLGEEDSDFGLAIANYMDAHY